MTNFRQTHKPTLLVIGCLFLLIGVAGCGGRETPSAAIENSSAAVELAALSLGPNVDARTVADVKARPDVLVLDVREQWEYDEKHIPGITLIPMGSVPDRLDEIPKDKQVIVTCRSGNRSQQVVDYLRQQGFTNIHNMTGGIIAWEEAGLPVE